jgi:hypothetical protein
MDNIFGDKQLKINRVAGDLKKAYLEDAGVTVYRRNYIDIPDFGRVNCAPYDNHFVFRHRFADRQWPLFCTCGGPAVITGYSGYKKDGSPQGQLLVCFHHANWNTHADGSS